MTTRRLAHVKIPFSQELDARVTMLSFNGAIQDKTILYFLTCAVFSFAYFQITDDGLPKLMRVFNNVESLKIVV